MEDIQNPISTGTLTITFNQSVPETNLNLYVSLNPSYIGTFGDITSADGGITYTGTMTLNEGINRINNKVNLDYNGIIGEASFDVVETDGVTITNSHLEKEFIDETRAKRYVTKLSPDGSIVGVLDLKAGYDTLSTIIYEYNSNTNNYVQKGSVLKTGTMIDFSNDGSYVLIGVLKRNYSSNYYSKLYYYKYNTNINDWEIKGQGDYVYYNSNSRLIHDIALDGSGKRIALTESSVRIYDYDEINNTLIETNVGGTNNQKYGKMSNDGNVLYVSNTYLNVLRYNYDGTNWTNVSQTSMHLLSELNSAGITNLGTTATFNISNEGKTAVISCSDAIVSGGTDINGLVENRGNITIILEYDEATNEFSVYGNIITHPYIGSWGVSKSVAITGDGKRIVVGDTGNKNSIYELVGKVEVYDYNSVTNNWDLYSRILGVGGVKDNFGDAVSITSDGLKITGTNHNNYLIKSYFNNNDNIVQEYSRVYSLEKGIVRTLVLMSMSDISIKFPETGSTFEVKFSTNDKTIEEIQGNISLEPSNAGTLSGVSLGSYGFSLVGTYNAASQTETTGNKLKYNEGDLSSEIEFVLSTAEKAISNICFYGESKVMTSEGYKEIREVKKGVKIQGEYIEEVTRTQSKEKEVVLIKKGAIMENMPLQDTRITKEHKVFYKGKMVEAKELVNGMSIVYEEYKGETLYNILLSGEGKMVVNGMIVETLSPSNNIAKLYKILKGYKEEEKKNIIKIYNEEKKRKSLNKNIKMFSPI
jgi:hypothetical protein